MPAKESLDSLITKHAAEFAEQMRAVAAMADKEEEIRIEAEKQLAFLQKAAGVTLKGKHEFTVASGRIDSVYQRVIIEYKNPSSAGDRIGETLETAGSKKLVEQIKKRFRDLQTDDGQPITSLFGVGCDGRRFIFVRWRDKKWDVQQPVEVNKHTAERFLWALFNLGTKGKAFRPEYLAADFGSNEGSIALAGIPVLYKAICNAKSPKAKTFFNQWKILFGEVCGYDVESPSEKIKKLAKAYGISGKVRPAELLFAVHTYYAVFMKLLAGGVVAKFHRLPDPVSKLHNAATPKKFKAEMEDLEQGSIFRHFNITNFLEGDLFAWYLPEWSDEVHGFLKAIVAKFDDYNPQTLAEEPNVSRDLLKKLYQELFPKSVRHDLGEYYTPDWLAEHVLNEVGYEGDPDKRILDPACGSGTFLVLAINRIRQWYEANRETVDYEEDELARKILANCIGFDLNPLAVMAARTNYLIAIRGLIDRLDRIEIPVYLCDSILTPSTYGGLFAGETDAAKELKTAAAKFLVPVEIAQSSDDVSTYAEVLEQCVRDAYSPDEFIERCEAEGLSVSKKKLHLGLYEQLVALDKANKNGVWARIIKNSFAPLFVGHVDFIVGNPPWINVENLPREYLHHIQPLWDNYSLRHTLSGPQIGSTKRDICALFVHACADHYISSGRRIGFVLTQSLFKSKGGGDGFRRFRFESGNEVVNLSPQVVHDLSDLSVFSGAINRTSVLVAERTDAPFTFPIRYVRWRPLIDPTLDGDLSLSEIQEMVALDELEAVPSDPERPSSPWLTLTNIAVKAVKKVAGSSAYRAHTGAYTGGLNGAYWFESAGTRGKARVYANLANVGKKKVPQVTTSLESELVYPLVRGRDVHRWKWQTNASIIVPFDHDSETWISESVMKKRFPKTYSYFLKMKEMLYTRKTALVRQQMKRGAFYSMVAVGPYTFAPWKVLFKRLSDQLQAVVVPQEVVPHEKLILIPCDTESEAHYVAGVLNSDAANLLLRGAAVRVQTIEYSPSDIAKIALPRFDAKKRKHTDIAAIARKCADVVDRDPDALSESMRQLNSAVASLLGLTVRESDAIRNELAAIDGGN